MANQNKPRRGHGEGSIYLRKDGRYAASLRLEDGKRKYFYDKKKSVVQEQLRQAINEQKQGILATGPHQKLKDYLIQWLEDVHKQDVLDSTYARHKSTINYHIIPELGHIQVHKLTPQQLKSFYSRKLNEGCAAGSVRIMHTVLSSALKNAVKWGLVSRNVCELVSMPRGERREALPLTKEQAQKLLDVVHNGRWEVLFTMALITGMREGELLALRWQAIDFERSNLYINQTVVILPGVGFVEHQPKTARGRRNVRLPKFVIEALYRQRERVNEMRLKSGGTWQENDLVFPNLHGGFIYRTNLHRVFRRILAAAGLPIVRFHDLRHSTATILLTMGVHPKVVQEILGHASISMTLDTYSHLVPSMHDDVIQKWEDAFGKGE